MNYKIGMLENKAFNFFKELLYNLALAICILLVVCLGFVFFGKISIYWVSSDSMAPVYKKWALVAFKQSSDYEVGDVIKFNTQLKWSSDKSCFVETATEFPIMHRIIAVYEDNGTKYYVAHGDNVQTLQANTSADVYSYSWETERDFLAQYETFEEFKTEYLDDNGAIRSSQVQIVKYSQIEGEVVVGVNGIGYYLNLIQEHKFLFIALVLGLWCVTGVVQNETQIKNSRRLMQ